MGYTDTSDDLRELQGLKKDIAILERQLRRRRKERNMLAVSLAESKRASLRQISDAAGITHVRVAQLRNLASKGK